MIGMGKENALTPNDKPCLLEPARETVCPLTDSEVLTPDSTPVVEVCIIRELARTFSGSRTGARWPWPYVFPPGSSWSPLCQFFYATSSSGLEPSRPFISSIHSRLFSLVPQILLKSCRISCQLRHLVSLRLYS